MGKATAKQADTFKTKLKAVIQDLILERPHDDEVTKWLRGLDAKLRKRMEKVGLSRALPRGGNTGGIP